MLHHILLLLSGIISGLILFQSAINAPLIFGTLDAHHAGPLIRRIFPVLFRVVGVMAAGMLAASILGDAGPVAIGVSAITLVCAVVCNSLVPATNRATDTGNQSLFNRLHHASVALTLIALLVNLCWVFVS
ncbi:DUF4149 domain-containing protein [Halioglobus pacificus]|nr:DUF4149 domain-containing protein [Halioglobus pacificus]NQY04201.1 DUF4149 domain-containing protein [Halieaceae bacterium]